MSKILQFSGVTTGPILPDKILEAAKGQLREVLLLGTDRDGNPYAACSTGHMPDVLWILERGKQVILSEED